MSRSVLLLVAIGGACGAGVRYGVTGAISAPSSLIEPGVLAVNTFGCLLLGMAMVAATARPDRATVLRAGVGTGFCGGLTTFSTLAVRLAEQLQDAAYSSAALETVVALGLGAVAIVAGRTLARRLTPAEPT